MSKFNKFDDQVGQKSTGNQLFTGLAAVKVLAINPTEEQLQELIGDKAKNFNTDYPLGPNFTDQTARRVCIWVTDKEEQVRPTLFNIELVNEDQVAKTGSLKILNSYLQDTWSKSIENIVENPKMSWFSQTGIRTAKIGEIDYYKFISQLLRFDFNSDVTFDEYVSETGIDFETVYNGDFTGLRDLVSYANSKEYLFAGVFGVKESGDANYQVFIPNSNTWFRLPYGEVSDSLKTLFKDKRAEKEAEGYDFTNKLYTIDFKAFNKEECFNSEPTETASGSWIS